MKKIIAFIFCMCLLPQAGKAQESLETATMRISDDCSYQVIVPTVGNSFEDVRKAVERFTEYVVFHPQNRFMLTAVGTDNGRYGVSQIAPLFRQAYAFGNVYVPRSFIKYVVHNPNVQ